jgi:origin recognition complex subunit 1
MENIFYTHLAINSLRGLFYDFVWHSHHARASSFTPCDNEWSGGNVWDVDVDNEIPNPGRKQARIRAQKVRNPRRADIESESERESESDGNATEDEYDDASMQDDEVQFNDITEDLTSEDEVRDEYDEPKTPSKKRKRMTSTKGTPRKRAHPTPNSRARLHRSSNPKSPSKKSPLKVRPPPPVPLPLKRLALEALPKDPWLRAMHALHVGSRPDELPCREEEYARCLRSVEELIGEGEGGCVCRFPFSIISLGEY